MIGVFIRDRLLALLCVVTVTGCSTVPVKQSGPFPSGSRLVLLENAHFNGERLTGRLLLGVREGRSVIELSSWPFGGLYVVSAKRCDSNKELTRYVSDGGRLASHDGAATSLSLVPGDWYGRDVDVPITEAEAEPNVDCALIEATLPMNASGDPGSQIAFLIKAKRNGEVTLLQTRKVGP